MANKRDYYEVLGVSKDASKDEIKKHTENYQKYHPDINKEEGADEKFKEISEAYEILSDDNKRANYDQFGHSGPQGGFGNQGFGGQDFSIFSSFFGGSRQRDPNAPRKGDDLQYTMTMKNSKKFQAYEILSDDNKRANYDQAIVVLKRGFGKAIWWSRFRGFGGGRGYLQFFLLRI